MATNKLIVDERQTDLGNFIVGRLLPFRKKRQVGPFTFIDHMGPAQMGNGKYIEYVEKCDLNCEKLTKPIVIDLNFLISIKLHLNFLFHM